MPLDFKHIQISPNPDEGFCSLDQLIFGVESLPIGDPSTRAIHQKAEQIKRDTISLCEEVFRVLVPDIDQLEAKFASNPTLLNEQILVRIESKLANIEELKPGTLEEIKNFLCPDLAIPHTSLDLQQAVAKIILDRLYRPSDLAGALNVLSSGTLLEHLVDLGLLPEEALDRLDELYLGAIELAETRVEITPYIPSIQPTIPPLPRNSYVPIVVRERFSLRKEEEQDWIRQKEPALFDIIAKASEQLGHDREHENKVRKDEVKIEEEKKIEKKKRVEQIAEEHPELKDELEALLGDPHFTDGPITQFQELLALAQLDKSKMH